MRLDRFLRKRLPLYPLSQIYRLLRQGRVRINGKRSKESYRLCEGDAVEVSVAEAELVKGTSSAEKQVGDLTQTEFFRRNFQVLYEDESVLVCNKPEGLVVHGGTGHDTRDTLIDLARSYLRKKKITTEPDLVHRLDRDTSGAIIIAKSKNILRQLNDSLREGNFRKEYIAICHGRPKDHAATVQVGMVRTFGKNDGTKMKVSGDGAASSTSYSVVEAHGGLAKLSLELHTGKTHQIRVHMAHIGHPLVGDVRYGDSQQDQTLFSRVNVRRRLYLHAYRIRFYHPVKGKELTLTAAIPEEFGALMRAASPS